MMFYNYFVMDYDFKVKNKTIIKKYESYTLTRPCIIVIITCKFFILKC